MSDAGSAAAANNGPEPPIMGTGARKPPLSIRLICSKDGMALPWRPETM